MKDRAVKNPQENSDPRVKPLSAMLRIAQMWRERATPDVAREVLDWEIRLQDRLKEIEAESPVAKAA
jgi:hypothetical protein